MSDIFIDEQNAYNCYPFADASVAGHLSTGLNDHGLCSLTVEPLQISPGIPLSSCIPHQNALGWYGTCGPSQADDAFAYTSAISTSGQIDTSFFGTLFLHQSPSSDNSCLQSTPCYPPICEEVTFSGAREHFVPHPQCCPIALPESRSAQKPSAHFPGKRVSLSRSEPTPPRALRRSPYPINTRRYTLPASVYQCQWFGGATPCGELVTGTKSAIARHLEKAHAIRLKADKTELACRWDTCGKMMRRESIPRHILAVHMQSKVFCPACKSRFARTDSLQRHRRTQCSAGLQTAGTDSVGE